MHLSLENLDQEGSGKHFSNAENEELLPHNSIASKIIFRNKR